MCGACCTRWTQWTGPTPGTGSTAHLGPAVWQCTNDRTMGRREYQLRMSSSLHIGGDRESGERVR